MSIQVTVAGTIQVIDPNTGTLNLVKTLAQSFNGTVSSQGESVKIGVSPTSLTLPISPVQIVYIANLSIGNTITVTWTPFGGLSNTVQVLQPLGAILMMNSNTTSGVSAISLLASGANTPVDFFLAG